MQSQSERPEAPSGSPPGNKKYQEKAYLFRVLVRAYSLPIIRASKNHMIVHLGRIAYVSITGMRFELHFMDGGSHMRRFDSIEDMLTTLEGWREKTTDLEDERTTSEPVAQC